MAVLQKNQIKIPYFNQGVNLRVGLNLLGLRNTSESLYTSILPGLNNVTLHIRYYSFYCWIIREYYNKCKKNSISPSRESFNKFIRRAEYLLAVIEASKGEERGGVPGINFASDAYDRSGDEIDIANAADKIPDHDTYWANPGGVLSQYYAGSLFDMGIVGDVVQDTRMINISKSTDGDFISGEKLADAFRDSVGENAATFLHIIDSGFVNKSTIKDLSKDFSMHNMDSFQKERQILIQMLLQMDIPTDEDCKVHRRRDTIRYYLLYCIQEQVKCSDLGFAKYMHDYVISNKSTDETALGWYAYYLNDMWQYYVTVIFTHLLEILKDTGRIYINDLVAEMCDQIVSIYKTTDVSGVLSEVSGISEESAAEAGKSCWAFFNLLTLVSDNGVAFSSIMQTYDIHSASYFDFAERLISSKLTLIEFVKDFLQQDIIYCHYALSFQKQQYTGIATQKFVIENDVLRFCDTYTATHTSPRLTSLKIFLHDLCLLDEDHVTKEGLSYLKSKDF